ncbi:MAG: DNA-3-methyladenine glycosylase 2 family protein [Ruminococcaceae bacterium]|nr:DNA-3-methyladenine glycosylase 2 family protein [Oscillospiraceae bacterium]
MQFTIQDNVILYHNVTDYDLAETFLCGQAFRFDEYEGGFKGFIEKQLCHITLTYDNNADDADSAVNADNTNSTAQKHKCGTLTVKLLTAQPTDELAEKIGEFLSLDMDYTALKKQFSQDETVAKAIEFAPGIRVLNQDFFETLITFIISQNNNIPRIKQLCDRLSENYGTKVGDSFAFPAAEQMKNITEQDYKDMKFGFRAKYLADAVAKVLSGEIDETTVKSLPYEEAQKYLMQIKGVGPKVADCVLLFSCRQYESFPKDVWIKKAMAQLFPNGFPQCCKGYEGIAQQYIFHYARHML